MNCALPVSPAETVLSISGWGRQRPGRCADKYLKCLVNWMPVLHLMSVCLFFKQGHTQSRIDLPNRFKGHLETGLWGGEWSPPAVIPGHCSGTHSLPVAHPYSHPWRGIEKSLSLCSFPLTREQNFSPGLMMLQCLHLPHPVPKSPPDRLLSKSQTQQLEGALERTKQHIQGRQ